MKRSKLWGVSLILISIVAIVGHVVNTKHLGEDAWSSINILQYVLELTVIAVGLKLLISKKV